MKHASEERQEGSKEGTWEGSPKTKVIADQFVYMRTSVDLLVSTLFQKEEKPVEEHPRKVRSSKMILFIDSSSKF